MEIQTGRRWSYFERKWELPIYMVEKIYYTQCKTYLPMSLFEMEIIKINSLKNIKKRLHK